MTALQPIPDGTIMFGLDGLEPEGPEDPTSARTVLWLHESPG